MKIKLLQQNLVEVLKMVKPAINPKSALPILSNVHIAANNGGIVFTTSDLETVIIARVSGVIVEDGELTTTFNDLSKLVTLLPSYPVTIEHDPVENNKHGEGIAILTCSNVSVKLDTLVASDFVRIPPTPEEFDYSITAVELTKEIKRVLLSVDLKSDREVFTGVLFDVSSDGSLTMCSTDGYFLTEVKTTVEIGVGGVDNKGAIIPAGSLSKLLKILPKTGDVRVTKPSGRCQVVFTIDNIVVHCQLIDTQFPDYTPTIPTRCAVEARLSAVEIGKAVKMVVSLYGKYAKVNIEVVGGVLYTLSGKVSVKLDCTFPSPPDNIKVSIYAHQISNYLKLSSKGSIRLQLSKFDPVVVRPVGDDGYTYVIAPINQ